MIRVVIADDHALVRGGLKALLEGTPDIRAVAEVGDADALFTTLASTPADVLLLDISMPGPGFTETLERLARDHRRVRTVVVSMHPEDRFAMRAFRAGARGYVEKRRSAEDVIDAIRRVFVGRRYVSPALAERLVTGAEREGSLHETLSDREFEVLRALAAGEAPKDIALRLDVSPKTVSTYRARILEKTGLSSTADLVRYVLQEGLDEEGDPDGGENPPGGM